MNRYVCIHAHFYQPPRENPWLEEVEVQDSAFPFHDWNERITNECYEPNATARILDNQNRIIDIVNNYARISFNFGPTLLSWLARHQPQTYQAILEADRQSLERFGGHGAALAQAYNHLIMPLANRRDKETQVIWGIRDFTQRFHRPPEGLWLPETAVDLETLSILAEQNIAFTILAPHQADGVRRAGDNDWHPVPAAGIDTRVPYLCPLPSGKSIVVFFYDGSLARDVAFGDLLRSGERFAHRLSENFGADPKPQLAHIATDGETYGHHHRFGEMALAYCLEQIDRSRDIGLTNYGEFLSRNPPRHEVRIRDNTSWSCAHGVGRWKTDCGCRLSDQRGWTQAWRAPLREALDWLRDELSEGFETAGELLFNDPWKARNDYVDLVLNRSKTSRDDFLRLHSGRELNASERIRALRLLEMQRHALLMFTSCGWFFDEISGIETTQILAYAGRAMQLAEETIGRRLENKFQRILKKAPSNLPRWKNGQAVYEELVKPTRLDLIRVAAHSAIAAQFERDPEEDMLYCYFARIRSLEEIRTGRLKLSIGVSSVQSGMTENKGDFSFAVLNLGGHNLNAGVCPLPEDQVRKKIVREMKTAFEQDDIPEVIRIMDRHFGSHNYSLWHLFRDQQRRILGQIMQQTLEEIEVSFQQIYSNHSGLMRFLREINMPIPASLRIPVERVINKDLCRILAEDQLDIERLETLAAEAAKLDIELDLPLLSLTASRRLARLLKSLAENPDDRDLLQRTVESVETILKLSLQPDLRKAQNHFFSLCGKPAGNKDRPSRQAKGFLPKSFEKLGELLQMGE